MTTHNISFERAQLHVEVDGSPDLPSLLLWSPGSCTLRVWDHLLDQLTERFQIVRIDVRGFGQSTVDELSEEQFNFDQYARDARHVLDSLGVQETHVWSQSWGTRPAIVFCARHQAMVKSAALYAANLGLPDVAQQRQGTKDAAEARRENSIQSTVPPTRFSDHANPQAQQLASAALRKFNLSDVIDDVTMPVLIGTGSFDPNLVSSKEIAERLPNATLREFEHVGHNAILEHPTLALDAFFEFHDSLS